MKNYRYIEKEKADYYAIRLKVSERNPIFFKNFSKWVLLSPFQIWRIPYSLYLFAKTILTFFRKAIYPPEFGALVAVIILAIAIVSIYKTWLVFLIIMGVTYFVYMLMRCIYEIRNDYRLKYNKNKGYNEAYDEYDIKYRKDDYEDEENDGYYYYYRTEGNTKGGNGGNRTSGGTQYRSESNNIFFGMDREKAKDEYHRLLKMYHPDNLETGDAKKAQDIIRQYEEYEEITGN